MNTSNLRKQIIGLILFLSVCGVYSQQLNVSEKENKAKAQELFDAKNYQEAMPLYAQLVSVYSNNSEYNYKFGVCALFGDRTDRRRPIRYLNNALRTMGNNPELNYYLGLAYYQNQEFTNAMKYLNLYLAKLDPASSERPVILEKVNACLNGMNLEHKNLISEIISKSEFNLDNFHRAYRADEFDGMLILKPENFISAKEKNSGNNSFVYISEPKGTIYFSAYEKGSDSNKDIYRVTMDENGEWGTPEKISDKINSMFDEEYPVLANGGTTLYFCSKGHNSLGGYDIFKSTYDAASNSFSEPENLGIGINSPFDDILFIPDKTGEFAYFSTNRDNLNNTINVYKVRLDEGTVHEEMMFARNNSSSKESNAGQNSQVEPETIHEKKTQPAMAQTQPKVAPYVKAASLKLNRTSLNNMADTAYMLISKTKSQLRSLTNKRDRANAICKKKKEEAKEMELLLEKDLAKINEYTGEEEFEMALQKTVELKTKIVQKRKSAEHANLIAWKVGKYIKIKNSELQKLKEDAGTVQSLSVSGDYEETKLVYTELMSRYNSADTLKDYSSDILQIAQGKTTYTVPEKALAYAEDLRQGFLNNTLIAAAATTKPHVDTPVPIVTVDNRTTKAVAQTVPEAIVVKQVEKVQYNLADNNIEIPESEPIEIDFTIDAVKADKIVEQVLYVQFDSDIDIDETFLELRFDLDMVKPSALIEMIAFNNSEELNIDEELEIIVEKEIFTDPLIEQVLFAESSSDFEIEDPLLELRFDVDVVEALPSVEMIAFNDSESELNIDEQIEVNIEKEIHVDALIEPVFLASASFDIEMEHPSLELRFDADVMAALPTVQTIAYTYSDDILEEDESLDLSFSIDRNRMPAYSLIQPIRKERYADMIEVDDDDLEINIENNSEEIRVARIVNSIPLTLNDIIIAEDENIEINFSVDYVTPENSIEPIYANFAADSFIMDEELEISIDEAPVETAFIYTLVQPVYNEKMTSNDTWPEETKLEINNNVDIVENYELVIPVDYVDFATSSNLENDIEINYTVDGLDNSQQLAAAISSLKKRLETETVNSMPAIGVELFYLRESLEIANDIETSRTDFEMLTLALTQPGDLSYEELLFAASLAQNPKDKLSIFYQAFIHIDRDWRAFNNAAISAINIHDLETAECFLYQASLISNKNGKVVNNMGILACYNNEFESAKDYFMTASKYGVNSEYNLQVVQNIYNSNSESPGNFRQELGDHNYYEVLGDASEIRND